MRLAEALTERADLQKRLTQLERRVHDNARSQEGEAPSEDAQALLGEAEQSLDRLEVLIFQINATNSETQLGDVTLTQALARRDVLGKRRALVAQAAEAASLGRRDIRYGRAELRTVANLGVPELRARADQLGAEYRRLDTEIQAANWGTELLEP
jgi:hypothetical protein